MEVVNQMSAPLCPECKTPLATDRGDHRLRSSLDVTLLNVELRRCPDGHHVEAVIPALDGLYRALAIAVITKPSRLAPNEVRFLRKHLDWSGRDMARYFGVTPETVSRWESTTNPMSMRPTADRLLRTLVANRERRIIQAERLAQISDDDAPGHFEAHITSGDRWAAHAA